MATTLPPSTATVEVAALMEDSYDKVKWLGQGSFGTIYKVRHKSSGQILARKEINYGKMDDKTKNQLHCEIGVLEKLSHPNIVRYHSRQVLQSIKQLHIYMEYCDGGDLGSYIKKLQASGKYADEQFIWRTLAQLADALYLCHKGQRAPEVGKEDLPIAKQVNGLRRKDEDAIILHRDLKPENIFISEGNKIKLGDFGLAKTMQSKDLTSTFIGTPYYMCPEICSAERYCAKSDIWSLGIILYEMCSRKPPFTGSDQESLFRNILRDIRDQTIPNCYSPQLRSVIESCLSRNPNDRPDTLMLLRNPNVKLARYQLSVEMSQTAEAANLAGIADAHKKLLESTTKLEQELQELRRENAEQKKAIGRFEETQRKIEIEWHAKATRAIHEKVEAERLRLWQALEDEKNKLRNEFEAELERRLVIERLKRDAKEPVDIEMGRMKLDPTSPLANRNPPKRARGPLVRAKTTANAIQGSPMDISPEKPTHSSPPAALGIRSPTKKATARMPAPPLTPARQAPHAPKSAYRGQTLVELARSPVKWKSMDTMSPVKWNPHSEDAPSPFLKNIIAA